MRAKNTLTESVRISASKIKKVRIHVRKTNQTIGGFIDMAIDEKLKNDKPKVKAS